MVDYVFPDRRPRPNPTPSPTQSVIAHDPSTDVLIAHIKQVVSKDLIYEVFLSLDAPWLLWNRPPSKFVLFPQLTEAVVLQPVL
jgi:hypothetical protein